MNLDDLACVNALESLSLSNTIGRNRKLIPDKAIEAIISGYQQQVAKLKDNGINITLCGGETADVGDLVRTLIIDSTLFARVKKENVIDTHRISDGDIIIGLSSTGQAVYESKPNSGIGSNGLTLARHALVAREYADKYPEILDPNIAADVAYSGTTKLFDVPAALGESVVSALLSPTRTYAPITRRICSELGSKLQN